MFLKKTEERWMKVAVGSTNKTKKTGAVRNAFPEATLVSVPALSGVADQPFF
ncbi:hypothetical protein GCM10020331_031110 [Ectobacillus funiculus]